MVQVMMMLQLAWISFLVFKLPYWFFLWLFSPRERPFFSSNHPVQSPKSVTAMWNILAKMISHCNCNDFFLFYHFLQNISHRLCFAVINASFSSSLKPKSKVTLMSFLKCVAFSTSLLSLRIRVTAAGQLMGWKTLASRFYKTILLLLLLLLSVRSTFHSV